MQYPVIVTPSARADIVQVNTWFLENHPAKSNDWLRGISQAVASLSKSPERCPVSSESEAFGVTVRQLLYGKKPHVYRILFSVSEERVFILRVRSTRQKSLLENAEENEQ